MIFFFLVEFPPNHLFLGNRQNFWMARVVPRAMGGATFSPPKSSSLCGGGQETLGFFVLRFGFILSFRTQNFNFWEYIAIFGRFREKSPGFSSFAPMALAKTPYGVWIPSLNGVALEF